MRTDLYIDGVKKDSSELCGSAGEGTTLYRFLATLDEGDHVLWIVTDSLEVLEESSETNNKLTQTITWAGTPDIRVVDVWTDPIYPMAFEPVRAYYMIRNVGTSAAISSIGEIWNDFRIDGDSVDSPILTSLAVGESYVGYCDTILGDGLHTMEMVTDMKDHVRETDEGNNNLEKEFRAWCCDTWDSDSDGLPNVMESEFGTDPYGCGEWAIIVCGGWKGGQIIPQIAYNGAAGQAYRMLLDEGLTGNSIYFFCEESLDADGDGFNDVDDLSPTGAELLNVVSSSTGWLRSTCGCDLDDRVYIYLIGDGDTDGTFWIDYEYGENITDEEMGLCLDSFACHQLELVIEAHCSGTFQYDCEKSQRVVVTSTDSSHPSYVVDPDIGDPYCLFANGLFAYLPDLTIEFCFEYACQQVEDYCVAMGYEQYPLLFNVCPELDSDGDGLSDEKEDELGTNEFDPDVDNDGLLDGFEYSLGSALFDSDTDNDGLLDGREYDLGTDLFGVERYAIIVTGGEANDTNQAIFEDDCDMAYGILMGLGYSHDHIMYMTYEFGANSDRANIDMYSTRANLQWVIQTWLASVVDEDDTVVLYLRDHGSEDGDTGRFRLNDEERVMDFEVDAWLDTSVVCGRIAVIIDCCYSGNWIHGDDTLAGVNRIILTSCAEHVTQPMGGLFSKSFWHWIAEGGAVEIAFALTDADDEVQEGQDPQIDDQYNPVTVPNEWLYL